MKKKFAILVKKPKPWKKLPSHLSVTKVEESKTTYKRSESKKIEREVALKQKHQHE